MSVIDPSVLERRFLAKVDKDGPIPEHRPDLGPCWVWTAGVTSGGYGRFWDGARYPGGGAIITLAHRWAYERWVAPLPARQVGPGARGICVLHECDTPACVNPQHLSVGTQRDNVADCITKGRRATTVIRKLVPDQRMEIKRRYAAGGVTQAALADEFGVAKATVQELLTPRQRKSRAA